MNTLQILLTIYFGLNVIIAIFSTIIFEGLGYYEDYNSWGKWGIGLIVFLMILLFGIPVAIFGVIEWLGDKLR